MSENQLLSYVLCPSVLTLKKTIKVKKEERKKWANSYAPVSPHSNTQPTDIARHEAGAESPVIKKTVIHEN